MNDPERLLHAAPDGLSARLLRAGIDEAPAERSLERTLVALGAASTTLGAAGTAGALGASSSAGALGAASAGKAVTTLTFVSLAKWAGVGIASGVAVSLAGQVVERTPPPHPAPPAALVVSALPAPERPRERAALDLASPGPLPAASVAVGPRVTMPSGIVSRSVDERAGAPLAAEVTFVDRGRALFQRGDASGALGALAAYEHTFPEQRLLPEVLYLRMEALSLAGERARASEIAQQIVRDHGKGPHAAHARAILSNH
jgi:hypothetical protein